jgi:hypothetical protein
MPTPVPKFQGKTNADLVNWALNMRLELEKCNSDKSVFFETMKKQQNDTAK